MKSLFETNINALLKVRNSLRTSSKMNVRATIVILGKTNQKKVDEAIKKIEEADLILQSIN